MVEEVKPKLAIASGVEIVEGGITGGFYMPKNLDRLNQAYGNSPEKLTIPETYHAQIRMCYDFYIRGGMAAVVVERIAELAATDIRNGSRKTTDEANTYYNAVLHRKPSRLNRFIRSMNLEYFITGMVLPHVDWEPILGKDLHPDLKPTKEYIVPKFDMYPPLLINVVWIGWGEKGYYLTIPPEDWKILKNQGGKIKAQQERYRILSQFSPYMSALSTGSNKILIETDAILRKEISLSPYPTPYLSKVLESLIFKQQLRRMDFAVASRIINAILLVTEGDKDFPLVEGDQSRLDTLKQQILARANNPQLLERLFMLFSNHTTQLTWISPDVEALLNQDKYRQSNEEIMEGLGFPRILVVGESKGAQAAEVSTWAIQPQMEELRSMEVEWMETIYEQCAELNGFRNTPTPQFTPIRLQDFVKTAAVFAQAYREGNISRTTRNQSIGLNFETEVDLMADEYDLIKSLPNGGEFPEMPYNIQVVPQNAGGVGGMIRPAIKGGRKPGTTNVPVTKKNSGVKIPNQHPVTRTSPTSKPAKSELDDLELWSDERLLEELNNEAERRGITITLEDLS